MHPFIIFYFAGDNRAILGGFHSPTCENLGLLNLSTSVEEIWPWFLRTAYIGLHFAGRMHVVLPFIGFRLRVIYDQIDYVNVHAQTQGGRRSV